MASDTRNRILAAATSLIARHGYRGTSLERVSRTGGVNRGSLYWFFKSKRALGVAVLDEIHDRLRREFLAKTLDLPGTARARIRRFLKDLEASAGRGDGLERHPLGSLVIGFSDGEPDLRRKFAEVWTDLRRRVARIFALARTEASLPPSADPDELAVALLCIVQGGMLLCRATGDPALFARACTVAARQIPWTERNAALCR